MGYIKSKSTFINIRDICVMSTFFWYYLPIVIAIGSFDDKMRYKLGGKHFNMFSLLTKNWKDLDCVRSVTSPSLGLQGSSFRHSDLLYLMKAAK